MKERTASCRCGQLKAATTGEPVRVSVCHCLNCQKRSGTAFAAQARFPAETVTTSGEASEFAHAGDSGKITRFHLCPTCGSTVYYRHDFAPETIAIALGAFDDPYSLQPAFSMFENRKQGWLDINGDVVEHD